MIVIYHNPACSTSRKVLDRIRQSGTEPVVITYLKDGWTRGQLLGLFAAAGLTARQAMRDKRSPAADLGLLAPDVTEDTILTAMVAHPELVNRPIVASPKGVRLCRPAEIIEDLLPDVA